jgi:hypothetical protein
MSRRDDPRPPRDDVDALVARAETCAAIRAQLAAHVADASREELDALIDALERALAPRVGDFAAFLHAGMLGVRQALARASSVPPPPSYARDRR